MIIQDKCCGCGACISACPRKCITMEVDSEGFSVPNIDVDRCIDCRVCEQICINNNKIITNQDISYPSYVAYNKDHETRKSSSSGGVFYSLAQKVLDDNGVVYGAAFDKHHKVYHQRVCDYEHLPAIMTSKYVQSDTVQAYMSALEDLRANKLVMYVGTPCQVYGMHSLAALHCLEHNLILVDFICHGVPSPGVWLSYVDDLQRQYGEIRQIGFRSKKNGWHDYCFSFVTTDSKEHFQSHEINAYMRTYLSNKNIRKSCFQCTAKAAGYCSDITLGDAWKIERENPKWSDDLGVSAIIVRTPKGKKLLSQISSKLHIHESNYALQCKSNPSLTQSTPCPQGRKEFFDRWKELEARTFWSTHRKAPFKTRIRYLIKRVLKLLRIDQIVRSHWHILQK